MHTREHTTRDTCGSHTGDTGFILRERPTDLVSPDVAFVRHDRLPPADARTRFLRVGPDLVEPRGGTHSRVLRANASDVLEAEDVLPGFRLSVADVFA